MRIKNEFMAVLVWAVLSLRPLECGAALQIDAPTTEWITVRYPGTNQVDYFNDQQTGRPEADIVGNSTHASFYLKFDNGNTSSTTDGTLAFRIRLGSDLPQAGSFGSVLFIGVDGNNDGALDLMLGADQASTTPTIKIWDAGGGLNVSPNSTSITVPINQKTYLETSANYHFAQISLTLDPVASSFDLDSDGTTDHFLSFALPFADLVSELSRLASISVDDTSLFRFVAATSSQDNAINADLNGLPTDYDSNLNWLQLQAMSEVTGLPEPGTVALLITGLAFAALRYRARGRS